MRLRGMSAIEQPAERLVELRIVDRENRAASQLPDETSQPRRKQRQGQNDVHPTDSYALPMEFGCDEPEEIDQPHDENPRGDLHEHLAFALHGAREQQRERHREVEEDQHEGEESPAGLQSMNIPG